MFWKYVVALLPQIAASHDGGVTRSLLKCEQVLIGKKTVEHGKNAGRVVAKQQRCVYCVKARKIQRKNAEVVRHWNTEKIKANGLYLYMS